MHAAPGAYFRALLRLPWVNGFMSASMVSPIGSGKAHVPLQYTAHVPWIGR